MARLRTILLLAFLLVSSGQVHAATIAVVRPSSSSPEVVEALFRLQGELLAVGLQIEIVAGLPASTSDAAASDATDAWLRSIAAERGVDAIIAVVPARKPVAVDVWIVERSTQDLRASRVVLEPDTPNAAATLAIRAIEVLRANFLVVDTPRAEPSPSPAAEPAPSQPEASETEDAGPFGFEVGASLLTTLHGVGPAILPLVRFDWALSAGFGVQATLAGLGTRPTVQTDAGAARVAQHHALLGLCYCPRSESLIRPVFSLAGGVSRTTLDGSAESPNRGHHVARWALLMDASLGARLRMSSRYHLGLAADVQLAQPSVAIHFVDDRVAAVGRPNVLLSLTAGAQL